MWVLEPDSIVINCNQYAVVVLLNIVIRDIIILIMFIESILHLFLTELPQSLFIASESDKTLT